MPNITIRPYHPNDEHALIELWLACNLVVPANNPQRDIERKLKVNPELLLIAEQDGQIVGSCMAGYEGHRGWINYLAVAPAHRRKGIARQLMDTAEEKLKALGCPKINLQVRETNTAVIQFYERIGFRRDPVIGMGKRLADDPPYDRNALHGSPEDVLIPPKLYANPLYYEIAFGFRDIPAEVDVFETLIERYSRIPVKRMLEIGCGNSPHLAEVVKRGYAYVGIDLSSAMLDYTRTKAQRLNAPVEVFQANMVNFHLPEPVDFAYIPLGSLYVQSTEELDSHFDAVANALKPGGLYLLDWCVQYASLTDQQDSWEMERDGIHVRTTFRANVLNAIEQTFEEIITLHVDDHGQRKIIQEHSVRRAIYPQEFLLFIQHHPAFEFVGWWNNWNLSQPLQGIESISRPITLLRRL